jgi:hypothetical protein
MRSGNRSIKRQPRSDLETTEIFQWYCGGGGDNWEMENSGVITAKL